jgi:toxin ParE1/3/4
MQSLEVVYRPDALADLGEIYRYVLLRSQNRTTARGFVERIRARCKRIGFVPEIGTPRDDLESGLRTIPFEHRVVIAYKVEGDRVRISNIFYGGRDFEALYRDKVQSRDED